LSFGTSCSTFISSNVLYFVPAKNANAKTQA
jgi:hypothetical protein